MSLTPPNGYVLTVAQIHGAKPRATIDCMVCAWAATLAIQLDGTDEETGSLVNDGIIAWQGHPCTSRDAGTGIPQPARSA